MTAGPFSPLFHILKICKLKKQFPLPRSLPSSGVSTLFSPSPGPHAVFRVPESFLEAPPSSSSLGTPGGGPLPLQASWASCARGHWPNPRPAKCPRPQPPPCGRWAGAGKAVAHGERGERQRRGERVPQPRYGRNLQGAIPPQPSSPEPTGRTFRWPGCLTGAAGLSVQKQMGPCTRGQAPAARLLLSLPRTRACGAASSSLERPVPHTTPPATASRPGTSTKMLGGQCSPGRGRPHRSPHAGWESTGTLVTPGSQLVRGEEGLPFQGRADPACGPRLMTWRPPPSPSELLTIAELLCRQTRLVSSQPLNSALSWDHSLCRTPTWALSTGLHLVSSPFKGQKRGGQGLGLCTSLHDLQD